MKQQRQFNLSKQVIDILELTVMEPLREISNYTKPYAGQAVDSSEGVVKRFVDSIGKRSVESTELGFELRNNGGRTAYLDCIDREQAKVVRSRLS